MSAQHLFFAGILGSSFLTSCMTSENWVDDDVYVVKEAVIPVETDITDETDYNAFVFNQRQNNRRDRYYSDFFASPYFMYGGFGHSYMAGGYRPYPGWYGYNDAFAYGGFYQPYWGSSYYNPSWYGAGYGNSWYGNGYGGYGNSYYGNNYGSNPGVYQSPGIHYRGPRGSSSGMGGVTSRSTTVLRSASVPVSSGGTSPSRTLSSRPVEPLATAGRTHGRVITSSTPSRTTVTHTGRPTGEVARPASTTGRSNGTYSTGRNVNTPSRGGSVNTGNGGISRNSGSVNTPSRSSGTATGGGSSRSSGSSGGGSGSVKTTGRR